MESIFSIDIVKYLSNAYAVSRSDNCFFVVLVFILSKRLLRTDKKRVATTLNRIIRVA